MILFVLRMFTRSSGSWIRTISRTITNHNLYSSICLLDFAGLQYVIYVLKWTKWLISNVDIAPTGVPQPEAPSELPFGTHHRSDMSDISDRDLVNKLQNLVPLVNIKIAGKWMFIPLKMVLIGIDPYPYEKPNAVENGWKFWWWKRWMMWIPSFVSSNVAGKSHICRRFSQR